MFKSSSMLTIRRDLFDLKVLEMFLLFLCLWFSNVLRRLVLLFYIFISECTLYESACLHSVCFYTIEVIFLLLKVINFLSQGVFPCVINLIGATLIHEHEHVIFSRLI